MSGEYGQTGEQAGSRKALQEQDVNAVEALRARYYGALMRFVASRLDSSVDTEDLVQEVFLQFCYGHRSKAEYGNVRAYLFAIARNLIFRHRKKDKARKAARRDFPDDMIDPRPQPWEHEALKIEAFIDRLPPKAQEAVRLRFIRGLGTRDAAREADCSTSTYYQRLHLGLTILKRLLQEAADRRVEAAGKSPRQGPGRLALKPAQRRFVEKK